MARSSDARATSWQWPQWKTQQRRGKNDRLAVSNRTLAARADFCDGRIKSLNVPPRMPAPFRDWAGVDGRVTAQIFSSEMLLFTPLDNFPQRVCHHDLRMPSRQWHSITMQPMARPDHRHGRINWINSRHLEAGYTDGHRGRKAGS
jgi:hypothetical protein